jgi:hypothetical protein
VSSFWLTLRIGQPVGGLWYWDLRCWDGDVNQQETLAAGAVKGCLDPQVSLIAALHEAADEVQELVDSRWVLPGLREWADAVPVQRELED